MIEWVHEGRNRAYEIMEKFHPHGKPLYGERHGGIGYCSYEHGEGLDRCAVTVRTSYKPHYLKMSKKALETNIAACQDMEINHQLILAFTYPILPQIYIIPSNLINLTISHTTKKSEEYVFTTQILNTIIQPTTLI